MLSIGFYPIVDRASWIGRLAPLGVPTIQLRIKELGGAELELEIAAAVRVGGTRLYINDHWLLAIKHRAYGVHLGQEDLADADVAAIHAAGLRLGVSTHSYAELARALRLDPTYVALGPIFPTTLKSMPFAPQGVARIAEWKALAGALPVVAIGGISLAHAPALLAAGADGIAVVSDVMCAPDPEARARAWVQETSS